MDLGSVLLGLALLVVIAFVVARPLLEQTPEKSQPLSQAEQLLGRREQVLTQLRDLDFDQAMSKINSDDYAAQRAQLMAEGVSILKELDGLEVGQPAAAPVDDIEAAIAQTRARRAAAPRNLEAEIEASVAERRTPSPTHPQTHTPALACAVCSAEVLPDDRFCPKCGSPLTVACPNCGRVGRSGDQFCAHCGQALPAPVANLRPAKAQG